MVKAASVLEYLLALAGAGPGPEALDLCLAELGQQCRATGVAGFLYDPGGAVIFSGVWAESQAADATEALRSLQTAEAVLDHCQTAGISVFDLGSGTDSRGQLLVIGAGAPLPEAVLASLDALSVDCPDCRASVDFSPEPEAIALAA